MSLQIIIRGKTKYGRTRSEQETNLRKEGYVGMSDENYDKCQWLERKIKEHTGSNTNFLRQHQIDRVK